jgi:hypothetical protein
MKEEKKKLRQDIKLKENVIHLQNQKIWGILPFEIKSSEYTYSFTMGKALKKSFDLDDGKYNNNRPYYDMFIISHQSFLLLVWNFIVLLSCIFSSYIYLYMASYITKDNMSEQGFFFYFDWIMEGIFLISIITQFLTDFED